MGTRAKYIAVAAATATALAATGAHAPGEERRVGDAPANQCALPRDPSIGNESEGVTDYRRWLDPAGTIDAVMLFVDFPDAAHGTGEDTGDTFGDPGSLFEDAPAWIADASFGTTTLDITPVDTWFRMPQQQADYGFPFDFFELRAYLEDAVQAADDAVDFSSYDILYVVPTNNADQIAYSPAFIANPGEGIVADGRELRHGVSFGQDMAYWGFKILIHETGHLWGLPDLYAYAPSAGDAHEFVGQWDLMGLISGHAPDLLAWHKWKLGWITGERIDCRRWDGTRTHILAPVGDSQGDLAVVVRTGAETAYVIENRQRTGADLDACSTGALIYHVDATVWGGQGPVEVRDAAPASSKCGDPFGDAPFEVGSTFVDAAAGVEVEVLGEDVGDIAIQVTLTGFGAPPEDPDPDPTPDPDPSPTDSPTPDPVRPTYGEAAGDGRVETAIEVARINHPAGSAPPVLIARMDQYADALAGAVLAHEVGGPVLLSPSDGLDAEGDVAAFIRELGSHTAYVLGGEAALDEQVEKDLRAAGIRTIERVAGDNRFLTADAVADAATGGKADVAYVVEGINGDPGRGWPDALSVSGLAAWHGHPILLTRQDALPDETVATILDLGVTAVTVIGGEAAVSEGVVAELRALGVKVDRVKGDDRYATSVAVADLAAKAGMSTEDLFVATGLKFPDALVAGPIVAASNGTLLLVNGEDLARSSASADWLGTLQGKVRKVWFLGGDAAVALPVRNAIRDILG